MNSESKIIYSDLTPIEANKLAEMFVKLYPTILDVPLIVSPTPANVIYHKKVKNNTEYYLASDDRYIINHNGHPLICKTEKLATEITKDATETDFFDAVKLHLMLQIRDFFIRNTTLPDVCVIYGINATPTINSQVIGFIRYSKIKIKNQSLFKRLLTTLKQLIINLKRNENFN